MAFLRNQSCLTRWVRARSRFARHHFCLRPICGSGCILASYHFLRLARACSRLACHHFFLVSVASFITDFIPVFFGRRVIKVGFIPFAAFFAGLLQVGLTECQFPVSITGFIELIPVTLGRGIIQVGLVPFTLGTYCLNSLFQVSFVPFVLGLMVNLLIRLVPTGFDNFGRTLVGFVPFLILGGTTRTFREVFLLGTLGAYQAQSWPDTSVFSVQHADPDAKLASYHL